MRHQQSDGNGTHRLRTAGRKLATSLTLLALIVLSTGSTGARAEVDRSPLVVVVDTDTGVDDATAIAWLLTQKERPIQLLGFGTVAGNTSVDNAANNVLTLLDTMGKTHIPVVVGAASPLNRPRSRVGALTHGPDGLWFTGQQHPHDLATLPHDVPAFYRQLAQAHPGATLIALGPLTNLALTLTRYPTALRSFARIIVLGGSKLGGNRTPVAETNIYNDPESAQKVLAAGLPVTMVTLDAFEDLQISPQEITRLARSRAPVARLISGPLETYRQVLAQGDTRMAAGVPDVAAVMYTIDETRGEKQSALVKVIASSSLTRGETIIGVTFNERLTMLASDEELSDFADRAFSDPNFNQQAEIGAILAREPDNAQVVLELDGKEMQHRLIQALTP